MAQEHGDGNFSDSQNFYELLHNICGLEGSSTETSGGFEDHNHNAGSDQQHSVRFGTCDPTVLHNWPATSTEMPVRSVGQYLGSTSVTQAPTPLPGTPCHGSVKQECSHANLSPDSGYHQPYSNESVSNNNHEAPLTACRETATIPEIREMITQAPSKTNYPGPFSFEMSFEQTDYAVKNANYTHSREVDKLYAKMTVPCPVQFFCRKDPPPGSRIRAMMVYMRDEQSHAPVTRCPTHTMNEDSRPLLAQHLIQTVPPDNAFDRSIYDTGTYNRNSVIVPFSKPAVGEQYFTVLYKFMCLSSCVGGINRRPVVVVFTLEDCNGSVLGRRCIEVKVCSSPGRDRKQDENRKRKKEAPPDSVPVVLPKKPKMVVEEPQRNDNDGKEEVFLLRVKGRATYDILKRVNDGLTLLQMATENQRRELRQQDDTILNTFLESINQEIN